MKFFKNPFSLNKKGGFTYTNKAPFFNFAMTLCYDVILSEGLKTRSRTACSDLARQVRIPLNYGAKVNIKCHCEVQILRKQNAE